MLVSWGFSLTFRYAEMMGDLVLPGGKILTECVEYDPTLFGGKVYALIYNL